MMMHVMLPSPDRRARLMHSETSSRSNAGNTLKLTCHQATTPHRARR
jgi:hypothetical protein